MEKIVFFRLIQENAVMADLEMGHWPKKCMEKITFNNETNI